jgi:hypothetical protein
VDYCKEQGEIGSRSSEPKLGVTVDKSSSHQLSQNEIASDNPCSRHLRARRFSVSAFYWELADGDAAIESRSL